MLRWSCTAAWPASSRRSTTTPSRRRRCTGTSSTSSGSCCSRCCTCCPGSRGEASCIRSGTRATRPSSGSSSWSSRVIYWAVPDDRRLACRLCRRDDARSPSASRWRSWPTSSSPGHTSDPRERHRSRLSRPTDARTTLELDPRADHASWSSRTGARSSRCCPSGIMVLVLVWLVFTIRRFRRQPAGAARQDQDRPGHAAPASTCRGRRSRPVFAAVGVVPAVPRPRLRRARSCGSASSPSC